MKHERSGGHMVNVLEYEREPLADHCGIVAAYAPKNVKFFTGMIDGLQILQTRGYDGAGFWALDSKGAVFQHKGEGIVTEVFTPSMREKYKEISAFLWMSQVRYGTSGGFTKDNVQPIEGIHWASGELFVIAHNGQFARPCESAESDTQEFAQDLARAPGQTWDKRITATLTGREGAWSIVIGTGSGLYVARDPRGIRPLAYGWRWDRDTKQAIFVVASETSALEAMGIPRYEEVLPGEILGVGEKGLRRLPGASSVCQKNALCIFETVYIQDGRSRALIPRDVSSLIQKAATVDEIRRRCGMILAREAPLSPEEVDIVVGVPGTGIAGGIAFAEALGLLYAQAIGDCKKEDRRTFMQADVGSILDEVKSHFIFDAPDLSGKRVCLVDDSLVRGNVMTGLIELLRREYGVSVVHVRILCPPIDKPCHLGINTRSADELIVARFGGDLGRVQRAIGADSLAYLPATGLREAMTGNPDADGFCMGCMAGHKPPIDKYGVQLG